MVAEATGEDKRSKGKDKSNKRLLKGQ
jgi:hypothetical protein